MLNATFNHVMAFIPLYALGPPFGRNKVETKTTCPVQRTTHINIYGSL